MIDITLPSSIDFKVKVLLLFWIFNFHL